MKTSNGCCGANYTADEQAASTDSARQLYENEHFSVGVRASTGKYSLFNKFTGIEEANDIANYVEALYMAEQFNYALINKTYIMDKIDFGAMMNFTGDTTVQ